MAHIVAASKGRRKNSGGVVDPRLETWNKERETWRNEHPNYREEWDKKVAEARKQHTLWKQEDLEARKTAGQYIVALHARFNGLYWSAHLEDFLDKRGCPIRLEDDIERNDTKNVEVIRQAAQKGVNAWKAMWPGQPLPEPVFAKYDGFESDYDIDPIYVQVKLT